MNYYERSKLTKKISIEEAMKFASSIGCVYPAGKESFYLCSNIGNDTYCIECANGYFYCIEFNDEALEEYVLFKENQETTDKWLAGEYETDNLRIWIDRNLDYDFEVCC